MAFPFIIISKITSFFTSGFQILYLIFIKQDICIKIFRTEESLTSTAFSFKNMVSMYAANNKVINVIVVHFSLTTNMAKIRKGKLDRIIR